MTPDWSAARERVHLDPTVTMLNTGSFGPVPKPVFERATEIRRELAMGPTDFFVRKLPPLLWHARERTAAFLGTTPQRLVFTTNVSAAINLIASSLPLSSPGEILLTDHEYGAMVWCWERAAQRLGLTVRTFPLPTMAADPGEIVDAATRAMTAKTRLFFFSHVLSPTGLVLPAKKLCDEARRRGIPTVVDGAHAPAMIPLDVTDVGADYYTGNLHKWLLAPSGAGFLAIGPGNEDRLQPLHVSWGYHADQYPIGDGGAAAGPDDRDVYGSTPRTRFLEFEGTRDVTPWLVVPDAIDFQAELGWEAIRGRIAERIRHTHRRMTDVGLPAATPTDPRLCGAMAAFRLRDDVNIRTLKKALWAERIEVPLILRPDRTLIRVSCHFYTTEAEIDKLAGVLPKLIER